MSLVELQMPIDYFPALKVVLWCFYPITVLVIIELMSRTFDDDDDQDGGRIIPLLQSVQSS